MKDYTSIDQATVHVLVLDLTDEQEKQLVTTLNAELNRRLTSDIMTLLNDDGLVRELGDLIKKENPEATYKWIAAHIPEIQELAEDNYNILLGDLVRDPTQFLKEDAK